MLAEGNTPAGSLQVTESEVGQRAPKQACVPGMELSTLHICLNLTLIYQGRSSGRVGNVLRDTADLSGNSEVHALLATTPLVPSEFLFVSVRAI